MLNLTKNLTFCLANERVRSSVSPCGFIVYLHVEKLKTQGHYMEFPKTFYTQTFIIIYNENI